MKPEFELKNVGGITQQQQVFRQDFVLRNFNNRNFFTLVADTAWNFFLENPVFYSAYFCPSDTYFYILGFTMTGDIYHAGILCNIDHIKNFRRISSISDRK